MGRRTATMCMGVLTVVLAAQPTLLSCAAATPNDETSSVDAQSILDLAERASASGDHERAERLLTQLIERVIRQPEPSRSVQKTRLSSAYYLRGRARFCNGALRGALDDFDKVVQLNPRRARSLWERGIACYYAKRYQDGRDQFKRYQEFDDADVENAVWHFLCTARQNGLQQARRQMITVRRDPRVPMAAIYRLFAGGGTIRDVLRSARSQSDPTRRDRSLFYAHLYVGLYLEATSNPQRAKRYLRKAAQRYRVEHYMGDVAAFHYKRLAQNAPAPDAGNLPSNP